jgi:threonine aldolase
MKLHMDGSRLSNAAARLQLPLRAFTTDAGVDILSYGGTKNGLLYGEAVIVLSPDASEGLTFLRKLNMQLSSKMRFVSAQLIAILSDNLWLDSATHANDMAAHLRRSLERAISTGEINGLSFTQATDANAVFAVLPAGAADRIRAKFRFYDWDPAANEVRWMCAFDTTEEDVDAFVAAIIAELAA